MRWARLHKDLDAEISSEDKTAMRKRLTARQLVWILLKAPMVADNAEQASRTEFVRLLEQASPIIASARAVVLEFLSGLREKNAAMLETWFADLTVNADLGELRAFAVGLERDRKALEAALCLPWSKREQPARCCLVSKNGPTEGL
jgi:hypothetical protein